MARRARKRSKSKKRRKHAVRAWMQVADLTKTGSAIWFEISSRGQKLGSMRVGRGSIEWKGKNRKVEKRLSWSRFAQHMEKLY